jgi:hypothetical protein
MPMQIHHCETLSDTVGKIRGRTPSAVTATIARSAIPYRRSGIVPRIADRSKIVFT